MVDCLRRTLLPLGGILLLAMCFSFAPPAGAAQNLVTIELPPIAQLAPETTTNVLCHIMPAQRMSGQPGSGLPSILPSCDKRPSQAAVPAAVTPLSYPCNGGCGVLNYNGGPVVTSTQQTFIYLNCAASCFGNPSGFINDLFSSNWIHVADQYMEPSVLKTSGRYTSSSTALSVTQAEPHTLLDSQLQTIILSAVKAHFPGGGGGGYNVMYSLMLPSGQDLCFDDGSACYCPDDDHTCSAPWSTGSGFCAYHSSFDSTDAGGNPIHVIYQAMPFQDVFDSTDRTGCQFSGGPNGAAIDSTNNVFSHELFETITDPDPNSGWDRNSDGQEIGDICEWTGSYANPLYLHGHAYATQMEYSNAAQDCVPFVDTLVTTHDFSADMNSDIIWRNTSSSLAVWLMNGGAVLQSAGLGTVTSSVSIIGQNDFNGDGKADVLWRDTSGNVSIWFMNGAAVGSAAGVGNLSSNWTLYGTGDLNGDGKGDLLWRDSTTGTVAVWFMNGAQVASTANFGAVPGNWAIVGADAGGILWRDTAGDIALWRVQNGQVTGSSGLATVTSNFVVQGVGDFNGDGKVDILWRDTNTGTLSIWFTNGTQVTSGLAVGTLNGNWTVAQIGDYNSDGKSDILLIDTAGDVAMWLMNGATVSSAVGVSNVGTTWTAQNVNDN